MGNASTTCFFHLPLKQFLMETLLGLCLLKQLILCEWKLQHDLKGAEQGQIFVSLICYLHHSIFPNTLNLDSLCYPIQQLFQPFCQRAPIKPALLCFFGCSAWDAEKKCACDKLKFFLLEVEIVMGRRREAINICFIIWKVSHFAASFNRKRKLSPLWLYLFQAFAKYPFNLLLKFIVEMFEC